MDHLGQSVCAGRCHRPGQPLRPHARHSLVPKLTASRIGERLRAASALCPARGQALALLLWHDRPPVCLFGPARCLPPQGGILPPERATVCQCLHRHAHRHRHRRDQPGDQGCGANGPHRHQPSGVYARRRRRHQGAVFDQLRHCASGRRHLRPCGRAAARRHTAQRAHHRQLCEVPRPHGLEHKGCTQRDPRRGQGLSRRHHPGDQKLGRTATRAPHQHRGQQRRLRICPHLRRWHDALHRILGN